MFFVLSSNLAIGHSHHGSGILQSDTPLIRCRYQLTRNINDYKNGSNIIIFPSMLKWVYVPKNILRGFTAIINHWIQLKVE